MPYAPCMCGTAATALMAETVCRARLGREHAVGPGEEEKPARPEHSTDLSENGHRLAQVVDAHLSAAGQSITHAVVMVVVVVVAAVVVRWWWWWW